MPVSEVSRCALGRSVRRHLPSAVVSSRESEASSFSR